MFNKVAFIGIGLIGSSLAHVIRRDGLADHISVSARSQETLDTATRLGIADSVTLDAAKAVADADLVMLCAPVGANAAIAQTIGPALKPGAIVSDVGSVKEAVIRDLQPHLPDGIHLVPGHPVAGTEHSGPEAGFPELFQDRWCILTPPLGTDEMAVETIRALWEKAGMMVEVMDPKHHDQVLGITSHLPHAIAYTIVGTATDLEDHLQKEVLKFSAGGFKEFTRIAASDPVMWRDIFLNNREALLEMLGRFSEDLTALRRMIRNGDGEGLETLFRQTRAIRQDVLNLNQTEDTAPRAKKTD